MFGIKTESTGGTMKIVYMSIYKKRKAEKEEVAEENQWAFEHGINLFEKEKIRKEPSRRLKSLKNQV
jgi:hypothetical protein